MHITIVVTYFLAILSVMTMPYYDYYITHAIAISLLTRPSFYPNRESSITSTDNVAVNTWRFRWQINDDGTRTQSLPLSDCIQLFLTESIYNNTVEVVTI